MSIKWHIEWDGEKTHQSTIYLWLKNKTLSSLIVMIKCSKFIIVTIKSDKKINLGGFSKQFSGMFTLIFFLFYNIAI